MKSGSWVKNVFSPRLTDNSGGFKNQFFDRKFDSPWLKSTELVNNVNKWPSGLVKRNTETSNAQYYNYSCGYDLLDFTLIE